MALSATVVWEVRVAGSGASDNNGGGYKSDAGTTDYSVASDGPVLALTDLACASNTTLTSATGGFTAAMVGNLVKIVSGTNAAAGWYQITARTDTNTVTIDRTCATGGNMTSGVGNVGGALATPGGLGKALADHGVGGMKAWIKSGTYALSGTTVNTSGCQLSLKTDTKLSVEGYQTTRGDLGTKPVIDMNGQTGITAVAGTTTGSTAPQYIRNLSIDGQSGATTVGISGSTNRVHVINCEVLDCVTGFDSVDTHNCQATGCTTGFLSTTISQQPVFSECAAITCGTGFTDTDIVCRNCLARGCTGDGFASAFRGIFKNCTSVANGGDGFDISASSACYECHAESNTGYGFNGDGATIVVSCTAYSNTGGATDANHIFEDVTALSASGFVDAGTYDYRPNATAGAGAVLRAGAYGVPTQTNNTDIGAVQHADPAGSGGIWMPRARQVGV